LPGILIAGWFDFKDKQLPDYVETLIEIDIQHKLKLPFSYKLVNKKTILFVT